MPVAQLIDHILAIIGKFDSASRDACKTFLRQNHAMICAYTIWRELVRFRSIAVTAGNQYVILPQYMASVLAVRYDTNTILPVQKEYLYLTNPNVFEQAGEPVEYSMEKPVATEVKPAGAGEKLKFKQVGANDNGKKIKVVGEYQGVLYRETVTLSSSADVPTANAYDSVWSIGKPEMEGDLEVVGNTSGTSLIKTWAEFRDVKCQQIHLHPTPSTAKNMLVLYKVRPQPLIEDNDTPMLSFMENALIAFTIGSMLKRGRQYAKANAQVEEGNALLALLKDEHQHQRANIVRIVPDNPFIPADDVDFSCDSGYEQFMKA